MDINLYSKAEYSQCCFIWKGLWEGSQRFLSDKLLCLFLKCAWKCVGFWAPFYLEIALVDPFLQEKKKKAEVVVFLFLWNSGCLSLQEEGEKKIGSFLSSMKNNNQGGKIRRKCFKESSQGHFSKPKMSAGSMFCRGCGGEHVKGKGRGALNWALRQREWLTHPGTCDYSLV